MTIEILMATMNRKDLKFLDTIFVNNDIKDFKILIVNQTSPENILKTNAKNITVINSFEKGSPHSRNLAISKATGDICLMADDDIVYLPNLKKSILRAYELYPSADFISFEAVKAQNKPYFEYNFEGLHNKKTLYKVCTITISFKREVIIKEQIWFNHFFGVGSLFKGATEIIFLRNAYDKGLKLWHYKKAIVSHPHISSGRLMGSDNAFFARAAVAQRFYGNLSYAWLFKYLIFTVKYDYVKRKDFIKKLRIGLNGIKKYRSLKKSGDLEKIFLET